MYQLISEQNHLFRDAAFYWLALNFLDVPVSRRLETARLFGSPTAFFNCRSLSEAENRYGSASRLMRTVFSGRERCLALAEKRILEIQKSGIQWVTLGDDEYPPLLREISVPPLVLYYQGDPAVLKTSMIALVGSRKPVPYGKKITFELARYCAEAGVTVVSGGALGIDALAHCGAMETGRTACIFGCGLNHQYPKSNRHIFSRILDQGGLLISEFEPSVPGFSGNFPRRNRIISGLAKKTVVTQAAARSGALITAAYANEQGRDVFAVPGRYYDTEFAGCQQLIKDGASILTDFSDVVAGPAVLGDQTALAGLEPLERAIIDVLKDGAVSIEAIANTVSFPAAEISSALTKLLVNGHAAQTSRYEFCLAETSLKGAHSGRE